MTGAAHSGPPIRTYYKWTQWIFLQLFDSWYDRKAGQGPAHLPSWRPSLPEEGNAGHPCPGDPGIRFDAAGWKDFDNHRRQEILMNYRLAYCGYGEVNWCEALGTVLANDEVIGGVSERGGYPVIKKRLRQWYLRITDYADRLLEGLETVDYQRRHEGNADQLDREELWRGDRFRDLTGHRPREKLRVYTTRPDTIFGVDFMVIAPEHELLRKITTPEQRPAVGGISDLCPKPQRTGTDGGEEDHRLLHRRLCRSIRSADCISRSGHPSTSWLVMVPAPSWPYLAGTSGISNSRSISSCPSPISSAMRSMASRPIRQRMQSWRTAISSTAWS